MPTFDLRPHQSISLSFLKNFTSLHHKHIYDEATFKGGYNGEAIDTVLAWDPLEERWLNAGNLSVARWVYSFQLYDCAKLIRYYHDSAEVLLESELELESRIFESLFQRRMLKAP